MILAFSGFETNPFLSFRSPQMYLMQTVMQNDTSYEHNGESQTGSVKSLMLEYDPFKLTATPFL